MPTKGDRFVFKGDKFVYSPQLFGLRQIPPNLFWVCLTHNLTEPALAYSGISAGSVEMAPFNDSFASAHWTGS